MRQAEAEAVREWLDRGIRVRAGNPRTGHFDIVVSVDPDGGIMTIRSDDGTETTLATATASIITGV